MSGFSLTPLGVVEHTKQTPGWNLLAVILQTVQYAMKLTILVSAQYKYELAGPYRSTACFDQKSRQNLYGGQTAHVHSCDRTGACIPSSCNGISPETGWTCRCGSVCLFSFQLVCYSNTWHLRKACMTECRPSGLRGCLPPPNVLCACWYNCCNLLCLLST